MNENMNLHSRLSDIAQRDEYLAESQGITREQARKMIKDSSFSEYVKMTEANADRGFVSQTTTQSGANTNPDAAPEMNKPRQPASADTNKEIDDALKNLENPTDLNDIQRIRDKMDTNPDQAKQELEDLVKRKPELAKELGINSNDDKGVLSQFLGSMKDGFMQGLAKNINRESVEEDLELARIRELAGLTESATTGATMSGNIATGPSIVGNTSDSHKPSVKLRHNMRLDREEREREEEQRKREEEREEEEQSESEIERLIKR